MKAVLRGKFIAIKSYLKKREKHRIDNLTLHLKQLEKEERKKPKISRRKKNHKNLSRDKFKRNEPIVKINKAKSWLFEKISKIEKLLARLIKKKEKNQVNKIRNEKGEVIADNAEIERIIKTIVNSYMAIKWITWKKWTDS